MEQELKAARITMGVHTFLAIIAGWLSPLIAGQFGTNWAAGLTGIVLLIVVGYGTERFVGKRGFKFWLANGIIIYLLIWLVSWVYFFNI